MNEDDDVVTFSDFPVFRAAPSIMAVATEDWTVLPSSFRLDFIGRHSQDGDLKRVSIMQDGRIIFHDPMTLAEAGRVVGDACSQAGRRGEAERA